ncbi:hypothetical protein BaRGS_00039086 [Batillaria attramentaria]|uniref:Secreted protein n=1 Tax=Batillaria attramentaria TaxID=370345 RepID=A0ABD0J4D4_9CAEN
MSLDDRLLTLNLLLVLGVCVPDGAKLNISRAVFRVTSCDHRREQNWGEDNNRWQHRKRVTVTFLELLPASRGPELLERKRSLRNPTSG